MRYNKYAMPVHPKVLEQDYKTELSILFNIPTLTKKLKEIDSIEQIEEQYILLRVLNKFLYKTWYSVNLKKGINLKDREMLLPLLKQMNRIFAEGKESYSGSLYRGVRLSSLIGGTDLSDTYPYSIYEDKVLEHLESLSYGLRSWSKSRSEAIRWARGFADLRDEDRLPGDRDVVVFEIKNPKIILDTDEVLSYYSNSKKEKFIFTEPMFDDEEVILNVKNPKIKRIYTNDTTPKPGHAPVALIYFVDIEDMG